MNYIKRLQQEREATFRGYSTLDLGLIEFATFLQSSKFTGTESDGGRKDWIATGDVLRWIWQLRNQAIDAQENFQKS